MARALKGRRDSRELPVFDLAERMGRLWLWHVAGGPDAATLDRSVPGLLLTVDPSRVTPYPSSNGNSARPAPGAPWSAEALDAALRRFAQAGVGRFFFWLCPREDAERIESDLASRGLTPFRGTSYPVLSRRAEPLPAPPTDLRIRRLDPARDRPLAERYGDAAAARALLATLGVDGFDHFMAFEAASDDRPVACATLTSREGIGHLSGAHTLEPHRRRGAQSALIAARVTRAAELGCAWATVETLGKLKTSLANLGRRGFVLAYKKKVFAAPK